MKNGNIQATPAADRNAIDAAVFGITLMTTPSQEAVVAIRHALEQFSNELPGEQVNPPTGFYMNTGGAIPPVGEALRFMAKPNGEHAWRVQLTGPFLQVLCADYTRFSEVWPKAMRYLKAMLSAVDKSVQVGAINHQYIDRFTYPAGITAEDYRMDELFIRDNPYLTPQSWQSGLEWHVYQGWFDNITPTRRILHQINISNSEVPHPSPHLACVIDYRCSNQFSIAALIAANELGLDNNDLLNEKMAELHGMNRSVIGKLLQPAKLQDIGMME